MLRRRARDLERPKSSIGAVKIEEFAGDRRKFKAWRRATEAQEHLYKLEPAELAMLVYLSTRGEARDVLDQRPLSDYTASGGLAVLWLILEEAFGESTAESFERAERELSAYRRLPGQSVASFVAGMKRLRMNYIIEDPDSSWSNRAWAQKLLNRASLSRRDRLDVFYSAGGQYDSDTIEKALRRRCSRIHEEERRVPYLGTASSARRTSKGPSTSSSATSTAPSSLSSASRFKSFRKSGVHVAGLDDENDDINDEEDLEQEANAEGMDILDEEDGEPDEDEGNIQDEDGGMIPEAASEQEVYEAFAAGWKAKAKTAGVRKARGWSKGGSAGSSSSAKSLADKKRISACSSCGQRGHWKGDSQCPNVLSGKDPPRKKPETSLAQRSQLHQLHVHGRCRGPRSTASTCLSFV